MFAVRNNKGFTLLELLVVVAILAAVSAIGSGAYWHVNDDVNVKLAHAEMQEIAAAIKRFKQDTGYYPKEGPFGLADDATGGVIQYGHLPFWAGNSDDSTNSTDSEKERWFKSPANFYQLTSTESPLADAGHMLATWNAESGRGWRGPYLQGFRDGYVDISDSINGTDDDEWNNDPTEIAAADDGIPDVLGIADPFEAREVTEAGGAVDGNLLDWSRLRRESLSDPAGFVERGEHDEREWWGRPYLFFQNVDTYSDGGVVEMHYFLVSAGIDGAYDTNQYNDDLTHDTDDIILLIE